MEYIKGTEEGTKYAVIATNLQQTHKMGMRVFYQPGVLGIAVNMRLRCVPIEVGTPESNISAFPVVPFSKTDASRASAVVSVLYPMSKNNIDLQVEAFKSADFPGVFTNILEGWLGQAMIPSVRVRREIETELTSMLTLALKSNKAEPDLKDIDVSDIMKGITKG